jgi:hypothetical protein
MGKIYTTGNYRKEVREELKKNEKEVDWLGIDQEIYDMGVLALALRLGLYNKEGEDFVLTKKGLEVTEQRQRLSNVEARAVIRETMRHIALT